MCSRSAQIWPAPTSRPRPHSHGWLPPFEHSHAAMLTRLQSLVSLEDLRVGARFLRSLPPFLRNPITAEQARAILARRLERRESDFLELIRRTVFSQADSPYRHLLALAGCEFGDIEALVRRDGVEGALRALLRSGVYLTIDEFKGRRAA